MPEENEDRSSGGGDRHGRLKAMDCYGQVRKMLASGLSTTRVAEFIQEEAGEYTDVKRKSLERNLRRFRDDEIGPAEEVAHSAPQVFEEEIEEFGQQLDVLAELRSLYRIQMGRISMNLDREDEMEVLLKQTRKEMELAADLVERIGEFQQEFGLEDRKLGTLELEATASTRVEDALGQQMPSIEDPSKRNQLAEFLGRLDSADPEVIDAVVEEGDEGEPDTVKVEGGPGGAEGGGDGD